LRKIRLGDGSGFETVSGDVDGGGCDFRHASFRIAVSDGSVRVSGSIRRERADGQVAACVLGFVHGAVGDGEDLFVVNVDGRIHVPGESGPADRDGAMERKASCAFDLERFAGNGGEDACGERGGFLALAKTGDDKEFFAAPADQNIRIANGGTDAGG